MNAGVEATTNLDEHSDSGLQDNAEEVSTISDEQLAQNKSEFALKLVNAVKAMNSGELSYHEMINSFVLADELKCLFLFLKALPYNPISRIYPETPFLIAHALAEMGYDGPMGMEAFANTDVDIALESFHAAFNS